MSINSLRAEALLRQFREVTKRLPEYAALNARQYKTLDGFCSVDLALECALCSLLLAQGYEWEKLNYADQVGASLMGWLAQQPQQPLPIHWVDPDLATQLRNAGAPDHAALKAIQTPVLGQGGILMLPIGLLQTPEEKPVFFVVWRYLPIDEPPSTVRVGSLNLLIENIGKRQNAAALMFSFATTCGFNYGVNVGIREDGFISAQKLRLDPSLPTTPDQEAKERVFMETIENFLGNLLVATQQQPHMIRPSEQIKPGKDNPKASKPPTGKDRPLWSPALIQPPS